MPCVYFCTKLACEAIIIVSERDILILLFLFIVPLRPPSAFNLTVHFFFLKYFTILLLEAVKKWASTNDALVSTSRLLHIPLPLKSEDFLTGRGKEGATKLAKRLRQRYLHWLIPWVSYSWWFLQTACDYTHYLRCIHLTHSGHMIWLQESLWCFFFTKRCGRPPQFSEPLLQCTLGKLWRF